MDEWRLEDDVARGRSSHARERHRWESRVSFVAFGIAFAIAAMVSAEWWVRIAVAAIAGVVVGLGLLVTRRLAR